MGSLPAPTWLAWSRVLCCRDLLRCAGPDGALGNSLAAYASEASRVEASVTLGSCTARLAGGEKSKLQGACPHRNINCAPGAHAFCRTLRAWPPVLHPYGVHQLAHVAEAGQLQARPNVQIECTQYLHASVTCSDSTESSCSLCTTGCAAAAKSGSCSRLQLILWLQLFLTPRAVFAPAGD